MAASNHGHTPAAWTGVTIAFLGFVAGGYFTVKAQPIGVVASVVVVLLGGVVGLVMRAMGLGQPPHRTDLYARAAAADAARRAGKKDDADAEAGAAASGSEQSAVAAG